MKTVKSILSLLLCAVLLCAAVVPAFAAEQTRYVVLGDSISRGAGIRNPDEACYGRIIANTNGYAYANFGVDGNMSDDLLNKLYRDSGVINAVKAADIISISIGGNDFLRDNMPAMIAKGLVENYGQIDRIVAEFSANFNVIIAKIKEYNPRALLLVQTLYNPMEGTALVNKVYAQALSQLNAVYTGYAASHPGEIEIVDVAAAFAGRSGLIAIDTIHPNAEGNYLIARTIQAKLYELGRASTTEIVVRTAAVDHVPTTKTTWQKITEFFRGIVLLHCLHDFLFHI